jgi:putative phosphoesterase
MKIGVISDIHANLIALHMVLNFFESQHVDSMVCAGDLVDGGPDGDAVVALVQSRAIPCVKGNHDEHAARYQAWLRSYFDPDSPIQIREALSTKTVAFLAELPLTLTLNFGQIRVLLAHGTPWNNMHYLFPETSQEQFDRLDGLAEIVVLGHTHVPMCRQLKQTWIVNPGSLDGNRRECDSSFAILETQPFSVCIYDLATLKIIRTCGQG